MAVADRDLLDANIKGLSVDRAFATAYEAALQLATVVVRASGYRSSSNAVGHHWRTIALVAELMGPDQIDRARYLTHADALAIKLATTTSMSSLATM